jgi:streptogrisin C
MVTAVILAGTIGFQAAAADPPTPAPNQWSGDVPDGMEYDPSTGTLRGDVLEIDAATISKLTGADYGRTLAHLRAQQQADLVAEELQARFPDTFAGMYWDDAGRPVAQFKNGIPAGGTSLIAAGAANGRSEVVRHSAAELAQQQMELESALKNLGVSSYVVGIDGRSNRVFASVSSGPGLAGSPVTREAVIAKLPARLVDSGIAIDVVDGPVSEDLNAYGGAAAGYATGWVCTTGFTVYSGSTVGVATAGHCLTDLTTYWDPFMNVFHNLTYKGGFVGSWGDFEWFTTSGTEVDDFYHNPNGALRDVSAVKNTFAVGDSLNWWGMTTWVEATGTVGWLNVTLDGVGRLNCMNQLNAAGGDSGGPVYTGGTAAGFIKAKAVINGAWRMCFSQARYIDDAIGVSIKLT